MLYRSQQTGKIIRRAGGGLANDSSCCCPRCACIGSVSLTIPAMATGPAYVEENEPPDDCPDCTYAGGTVEFSYFSHGDVISGEGEEAEIVANYCQFVANAPFPCGGKLYISFQTANTGGSPSSWVRGEHNAITISVVYEPAAGLGYTLWSWTVNCSDDPYPFPGTVDLPVDAVSLPAWPTANRPCFPVDDAPATLAVSGDGCCACLMPCEYQFIDVVLPGFEENLVQVWPEPFPDGVCSGGCEDIVAGAYTLEQVTVSDPPTACCYELTGGITGAGANCPITKYELCISSGDGGVTWSLVLRLLVTDPAFTVAWENPIVFELTITQEDFCNANGQNLEMTPLAASFCSALGNAIISFTN